MNISTDRIAPGRVVGKGFAAEAAEEFPLSACWAAVKNAADCHINMWSAIVFFAFLPEIK